MSTVAVQAIGVGKTFGDTVAVHDVNLTINCGEFFSLLGPSGCGKTTFLRLIAGFEEPTAGRLLIADLDMARKPPHKRPVNMVFQSYALFPHMRVRENIAFGLAHKSKLSKSEISLKVNEALELVRLRNVSDHYPHQLSGGQQQRIALARAIVMEPKVLLLDEPLSALDPRIREEMQSELARLQRESGLTFVMVTHDQREALALSHRIAVFSRGKLEQVGTPSEIYEAPKSLFVAEFIGQTNILNGILVACEKEFIQVELLNNGQKLWVSRRLTDRRELRAGSEVAVWVKPHAISIEPAGTPFHSNQKSAEAKTDSIETTTVLTETTEVSPIRDKEYNVFPATIASIQYQGFLTEFIVQVNDVLKLKVSRQSFSAEGANKQQILEIGDSVICGFHSNDCSFFGNELPLSNTSTGKAITRESLP